MGEESLKVFVGASTEGDKHAVAAKRVLEEPGDDGVELNVRLWKDTFPTGKTPIESLEKSIEIFDFAVFVLTKDDLLLSREVQAETPRNNVILELGLFTGKLGRDRVFAIGPSDNDIIMPSDYIGVGLEKYTTDSEHVTSAIRSAASKIRERIVEISLAPRPETRTEAAARSLRMKLGRGSPLSSVGYGEQILQTPKSRDVNGAAEMNFPPPPSWKELLQKRLLITVESTLLLYGTDVVHPSWGMGKVVEVGPETDKGRLIVVHFQEGGEGVIRAADLYYAALPDR